MKRRIATLAIVGAMAVAAMAPATVFASPANNQTTVGYVPGGTSIDGHDAVVVVPKDTMFGSNGGTINDFDVTVMVFDSANSKYVTPTTSLTLSTEIAVKVKSKNVGKLVSATANTSQISYEYHKGATTSDPTITFSNADTYAEVGRFSSGANSADTATINGTLKMTETTLKDADFGQSFSDVLTYQFTAGTDTYPNP